jgi:phytoene dehydrogenase-like protein
MMRLAGDRLPETYRKRLSKFKTGNAASRVDFVLSGPVPWANEQIAKSGTVHVGGTRRELARAEAYVAAGRHAPRPYVLVSQPSGFDPSRSPSGTHTLWTYSHVPRDSNVDQTEPITAQLERFAPGFRDLILTSRARTAVDLENYNPNYIGGDIATGDGGFAQLVARPVLSPNPWRTPYQGLYLGSAAAAPGPGVHGLAGWRAALTALRDRFDIQTPPDLSPDPEVSAANEPREL